MAKKTASKKTAKKKTAKKETAKKETAKKETAKKETAKKKTSRKGGSKYLLIVESPAKAKTINKFLGSDFIVKASMGHVRDIPAKGRGKKAFGIDFENNYKPSYVPLKGRERVLKDLATASDKADAVYLAPDPDREGEAIAWHLKEALHLSDDKVRRVTFNSITRGAVREAIESPTAINMNLVNAQQGRRVLDRIVGFSLSPFLWKKVTKGLSAGRVQSVAVRIVVEREKEIAAFEPREFWRITAQLFKEEHKDSVFSGELVKWKDQKFALGEEIAGNGKNADTIVANLQNAEWIIQSVTEREMKGRPSPSFITSTLQQAASTFLRFNTGKTMRVAQQLYEGVELEGGAATGLITYMRTDSTRIAPEALEAAREHIKNNYPPEYLPETAQLYKSRKGAQDAHEAIRPTSIHLTPDIVKAFLSPEQFKLYDLIWRRFMASQMMPAIYKTTTASIAAGDGIFEAKGKQVIFDGHTIIGIGQSKRKKKTDDEEGESKEEQVLPPLKEKDSLELKELTPTQHFTQPPPRFSEAGLVKALEKEGIGRPSTYAPIIQTIQDRGYVRQEKRRFHATELGTVVTDILIAGFPDIMELEFTARMEDDLDLVEEGEVDWVELVDRFYKPFELKLADATENTEPLKGRPAPDGEVCPLCEKDMTIRYSQRGAFLGCSGYPECKGTRPMPGEDQMEVDENEETIPCPACEAPMIRKRSRFGYFLACSQYPECKQTKPLGRDGKPVELPEIKADCEKCSKEMVVKMGRRGAFLACSGYPDCKNTKHIDKNGNILELPKVEGEVCEKCGSEMVVRMSRRGPFLACSAYPKCKNAKPLPKSDEDKEEETDKEEEKPDNE